MCEAGVEENVVSLKVGLDCKDVSHLIMSHFSVLAGFYPTDRLGFTILSKDASSALDTPRRTSLWTAEHFCKGDLTVTLHFKPPGHGWKVCPMLVPLERTSSKVPCPCGGCRRQKSTRVDAWMWVQVPKVLLIWVASKLASVELSRTIGEARNRQKG